MNFALRQTDHTYLTALKSQKLIGNRIVESECQYLNRKGRKRTIGHARPTDSNRPTFWRSLIRVFVDHMKKLCILGYPKCAQLWFWSACAHELVWIFAGRCTKVRFLTLRLICFPFPLDGFSNVSKYRWIEKKAREPGYISTCRLFYFAWWASYINHGLTKRLLQDCFITI